MYVNVRTRIKILIYQLAEVFVIKIEVKIVDRLYKCI